MARNKHPEKTVDLILDGSFRLFMKKGYEHTSVQDIIDQLGGLSKGAIYHHFKSKEDILIALTERMTAQSDQMLRELRDRSDLSGMEKLRMLFKASINRPAHDDIFAAAPNFKNNPKLVFLQLYDTVEQAAHEYLLPILKQGIAEGSIRTEYPEQVAELAMLAANIWMNPMVFDSTEEETYRKLMVFDQMMRGFGLDIVDQDVLDRMQELASIYQEKK